MDGHQVTLVMVESQTSHNTSVKKKIRIFFLVWSGNHLQSNFGRRRNRFFQTVFFFFSFTSLAIYFSVIAVYI
ncbi:Uncharacterized protein APZ42_033237 [Daphnia magna]|uniref:Uncharacterized protein n=1 Tax=Daphnia magna TaxID=35525 RepID=A0A164L8Q0_9CRUS|nr:Uncharacterized protein APZ42_033237 [Daphnia magna]